MKSRKASRMRRRRFLAGFAAALGNTWLRPSRAKGARRRIAHIVPNFHPASCGWLTNFSKERVYCANSYLDHLDRVRDDREYSFVLSEVNNIIAIMNFQPRRIDDLRRYVKEGRVELVNGFFLESTVNLSGGEALVRLGIEGLRWQQEVFGLRPRFAWIIDVCGTHDQMAQIAAGLGLEAMVYTRANPTGSSIHWAQSPDGSRILALSPGHYSELGQIFSTQEPFSKKQFDDVDSFLEKKEQITPAGAPILVLAGNGDYALAPRRKEYPGEFLRQWKEAEPQTEIRFGTAGQYLDAVLPGIRAGAIKTPTLRGGTAYNFHSFWIQNPRVKHWYRRSEHALQAAEMLAALASLRSKYAYPVQRLYHAWLQMCLNMDRNTLWGAAGGMVFEHDKSWDVRDRFEWVEAAAAKTQREAARALHPRGGAVGFFNPLNWQRSDPVLLDLPPDAKPGNNCQRLADGRVLCKLDLNSAGITAIAKAEAAIPTGGEIPLPASIETRFYTAKIDAGTGALMSLRLKPSGREILGGPANVVVAEKPTKQSGDPGDHMQPRPQRERLKSSGDFTQKISASEGPLAIVVEAQGEFLGGGLCRRAVRFYRDHARIDFETTLVDVPDRTVVVAEFPLSDDVIEVRRGIPYGFSHGAWAKPNPELNGWTKGIVPAVRWSHYAFAGGGGIALFDRGLSGRELNDKTPILYLLNATDKYYGYPNPWLSGKGSLCLEYALAAHEGEWKTARVPQSAWEYNCPPTVLTDCVVGGRSFLQTSGNVIVEALRRVGSEIELRLAECLGYAGTAEIRLDLPHTKASLTDMLGRNAVPLRGGPVYRIDMRPQQIVTMRFAVAGALDEPTLLLRWDELVPPAKRDALNAYSEEKGHPPRGN